MSVVVVVLCRDRGRFLLEAVASADRAGAAAVVIADGRSTDAATLGVLDDLGALGFPIVSDAPGAAVNEAVRRSDAGAVLVLDAVDRARTGLVRSAACFDEQIELVYGDAEWFGDRRGFDLPGPPDVERWRHGHGVPSAVVVARAAWERAGGYRASLPALWGWDLLLRLAGDGARARHVPDALSDRRAVALTAREIRDRRAAIMQVVAAQPARFRDLTDDDLTRLQSDLATEGAWACALDLEAVAANAVALNEVERDQLDDAARWLRSLATEGAGAQVAGRRRAIGRRIRALVRRGGGR